MKRSSAFPLLYRRWMLALALVALSGVSASAYTLIVAPARYSVLQVTFDLLARTPSVLVSYQGEGTAVEPVLHAWNGSEWALISMKDFREGNFLQRAPDRAVLIGDDRILPAQLMESSTWIPEVVRVRDLTTSALVNEFGHILKWDDAEWLWFAKRYNLSLRDESEARRNSSWYDRPGPLPGRPQVLERITQGPAIDPAPVPVVPADEVKAEPVDLIDVPAVESAPAAVVAPVAPPAESPVEVAPAVVPEAAPVPVLPAANPSVDATLDQQTEEALKAFK